MVAMNASLQSDAGRRLYARRKQSVEPVFGIIRAAMGFNRFLLRGKAKVQGEWQMVALAYNFGWLHRLSMAPMAQTSEQWSPGDDHSREPEAVDPPRLLRQCVGTPTAFRLRMNFPLPPPPRMPDHKRRSPPSTRSCHRR